MNKLEASIAANKRLAEIAEKLVKEMNLSGFFHQQLSEQVHSAVGLSRCTPEQQQEYFKENEAHYWMTNPVQKRKKQKKTDEEYLAEAEILIRGKNLLIFTNPSTLGPDTSSKTWTLSRYDQFRPQKHIMIFTTHRASVLVTWVKRHLKTVKS